MKGNKRLEKVTKMTLERWRIHRALLWIPVLIILMMACSGQAPSESPVVTVNGEQIGSKEFEIKLAEEVALAKGEAPLKVEQMASLKEEVLNYLIEERLMLQRARELSLTVGNDEIEARIGEIKKDYSNDSFDSQFGNSGISYPVWRQALKNRMLLEKVIVQDVNAKIQVTDGDAELYFKANRKAYLSERRVRAAQIVVRDRDRAGEILKRLKAGDDFDKVAREVSIGPEAQRGGDLDFFEQGMMPEAIDRVVFSMPIGKMSGVVKSPYGFHIFKILDRQERGGKKFAEVKELVRADLRKLKEAEAYEHWVEGLKAKAVIQINRPLSDGAPPGTSETKSEKPMTGSGKH
jgi:parvulin-like peptidyl-prolyl isomerase